MYAYSATVVRWIDGDTVDLHVDLGFHLFAELRFRLYGIDTPERGQKNHDEATALCNSLAPTGSQVFIRSHKDADKYGRWLADVDSPGEARIKGDPAGFLDTTAGININSRLVEFGLAVPYFGGTKGVAAVAPKVAPE